MRASYAICTTPRTASVFLCQQLLEAGLGDPGEWVADGHYSTWIDLPRMRAERSRETHIFGIKLFWAQREREYFSDFDELMPAKARWIYLYRKDVESQARSYLTALHSGVWFAVKEPYAAFPEEQIEVTIRRIERWNEDWKRWFGWKEIDYLTITTEEFLADPAGVTDSLGHYILQR
jgi:LPS sulfotransferase NodH